jgi:hypothetical protein
MGRGDLALAGQSLPSSRLAAAASAAAMEELQKLKQLYEQGFMTKEEYDSRRLKIIDAMTNTVMIRVIL